MFRNLAIILLLLFTGLSEALAQDSLDVTPFRKGRIYLSMLGSLTSTGVDEEVLSLDQANSDDYLIAMKLGTFLANRFAVGMDFRVSRAHFGSILIYEQEELSLGPMIRYYLSKDKYGSLFPQLTLLYYSFYNTLRIDSAAIGLGYVLDGYGFGAELAFGYSYIVIDRISVEVGIGYSFSYNMAELRDEIASSTDKVDYYRTSLRFYFGIGVLFGRIRKEP